MSLETDKLYGFKLLFENELKNIHEDISKIEENHKESTLSVLTSMKEQSNYFDSRFKMYQDSTNITIENLRTGIQCNAVEHQKLKETVFEIRSHVERATDRNELITAQILTKLDEISVDKKDSKIYFVYPFLVTILMFGLGILFKKYIWRRILCLVFGAIPISSQ